MKISESKMDANGTQLFQPWKWCCTVEWSTIIKTIGIVKKCSNKQFLSLVWVGMADIIVNNESSVILNCHMLIVECYGHKDVELDTGITNNFYWQIFLPILHSEDFAEEPSLSH